MLEEANYDSQAMRDFVGIDLAVESVTDETTLLRFLHLLEKHVLTQRIFEENNASLVEQGCSWARARSSLPPSWWPRPLP